MSKNMVYGEGAFIVNSLDLHRLLNRVVNFTSKNSALPTLNKVCVWTYGDEVWAQASDRFRAITRKASRNRDIEDIKGASGMGSFLLHRDQVKAVLKMIKAPKNEMIDSFVTVTVADGSVEFVLTSKRSHASTSVKFAALPEMWLDIKNVYRKCILDEMSVAGPLAFNGEYLASLSGKALGDGSVRLWSQDDSNCLFFAADNEELGVIVPARIANSDPGEDAESFRNTLLEACEYQTEDA